MTRLRLFSPAASRRSSLAVLAVAFLPAMPAAEDDPAALLRGDPVYVKKVPQRDFEREFAPYPVYFPPHPPALGAGVERVQPLYDLKWIAPGEVAEYVSEPFYPRLAMLIAAGMLDTATARRVDAYRDERRAFRQALEDKLAELHDTNPQERLARLQALARAQTPRLEELEREAERLRGDLASPALLRNERLRRTNRTKGSGRTETGRLWEYEIMRNAAYLTDGLSPAQRRLLREALIELDDRPEFNVPPDAGARREIPLYFSPDTSVVLLPADLPADLAGQVAAYQAEKKLAKKQLRDLLYAVDDSKSEIDAIRDVRAFALKQAPQLAALEEQADELRKVLGPRWRATQASIPATLEPRLAAYFGERRMIDIEIASRVMAAKRPLLIYAGQRNPDALPRGAPIPKMDNRSLPAPEAFRWLTGTPPDSRTRALYKVVHTALGDARRELADRIDALDAMRKEIVADLARVASRAPSTATPSSEALAVATFDFNRHEAQYRLREEYGAYAAALFEPGLSPEQRRLLYDGAIERLALPLPGGAFLPWPAVR